MRGAGGNLGLCNLATLWRSIHRAGVMLALLVAGGAFSLQLSGLDPRLPVGADTASGRSQLAIGLAFAVLLAEGGRHWRRALALVRANGPLLALPALATISTLWAPDPEVALRRALAFAATLLGGIAIGAAFPGARALRLLAQSAALGLVLSIAYVGLAPGYGMHRISDGVQSVHAGDWRGLFVHRTALGQLAALGLALAIYGGPRLLGSQAARLGAIAAAGLCLVMARSGGGWVSAGALLATPWIVTEGGRLWRRGWLMGVGLAVSGLALAAALAPVLAPLLLQGLGKDATLTGRTPLWSLMLQAARIHPLFGYGYSTGFREGVAQFVAAHSRFGYVPNAQNGYLDVVLNLGLVGLALALWSLATALRQAVRLARAGDPMAGLPLLIVVFIVEMNGVEAALISANDIFVLIYAVAVVASGEMLAAKAQRRFIARRSLRLPVWASPTRARLARRSLAPASS